jgi:hypothetical protein
MNLNHVLKKLIGGALVTYLKIMFSESIDYMLWGIQNQLPFLCAHFLVTKALSMMWTYKDLIKIHS